MILIILSPGRVRISGHAGAGPKGADPVCAGASVLACTMAQRLRELEQTGAVTGLRVALAPGRGEIACCGGEEAIATAAAGFRLLARHYPAYVTVTDKDES